MSTEEGFLAAIHSDPDDDVARLVFADWLEEQGRDAQAELIRVQIQYDLERWNERPDESWAQLSRHELRLRNAETDRLLADLTADERGRVELWVARGFPESLTFRQPVISDYRILPAVPGLRILWILGGALNEEVLRQVARMEYLDQLVMYPLWDDYWGMSHPQATPRVGTPFEPEWLTLLLTLPPWTSVRVASPGVPFEEAWRDFQQRRIAGIAQAPSWRIRQVVRFRLYRRGDDNGRIPAYRGQPFSGGIIDDAEDFDLALLPHVPELQDLDLSLSHETVSGLQNLARLPALHSLSIEATRLDAIHPLAGCPGLETLRITCSETELTDAGTAGLEQLVQLRELRLLGESMAIREGTIQRLASLRELRVLELRHQPLEQDALTPLEGLSQLERLVLNGPIQDAHLRSLAHLRELTTLVLRGSQVSDAGLVHLSGLEKLTTLAILGGQTTATEAGARNLAGQLPAVTVVLNGSVVKSPRQTITFRRRQVGGLASMLFPDPWSDDPHLNDDTYRFWVNEEGWQELNSHEDDRRAGIGLIVFRHSLGLTAAVRVDHFVNLDTHVNPQVLEREVVPLAGSDTASCIFATEGRQSLVCSLLRAGVDVFLNSHAPVGRFGEFRDLFCFMARSIRIGEQALVEVGETVTVAASDLDLPSAPDA